MANKIQIRRGQFAGLPQLDLGEPALTTDTGQVYFGGTAGNIELKTAPPSADRTIYVATAALGGQTVATQGATGLELASGAATSTVTNKLVDSSASFTAALVNMTLYNKTDDTWAKVTAVDSPTQLSLSADVMASGELYVVASAVNNIPEAFLRLPDGYVSNITLRISPGTFADDVTFIGKNAGGNFSLSVRGSTTGTTTISGKVDIRQRLALRNLTFTNKVRDYFGADVSWYTCVTSGASKLYVYSGSANYFEGSTIVFGNDPGSYIAVSSTITKGYMMYVASSTLGGDDAVADGLQMYSGSATSTTANKLVDSSANFGTDVVGKTVYNSVDDTWAKVTARDSSTQLSLSADIMASGEAYVIANAFSTFAGSVNAVPATVNCDTTIKFSNETWGAGGVAVVSDRNFGGNFKIFVKGSKGPALTSGIASAGANYAMGGAGAGSTLASLTDSSKAWMVDAYKRAFVEITGGTGAGQIRAIQSNTALQLKIVGFWDTVPDATSTYKVYNNATIIDLNSLTGNEIPLEVRNQKNVQLEHLHFKNWHGAYAVWANTFASIYLYQCRFDRSRTDTQGRGLRVESSSVVKDIRNCVFYESAGTSFLHLMFVVAGSTLQDMKHCYFTGGNINIVLQSGSSIGNASEGLYCETPRARHIQIQGMSRFGSNKSVYKTAGDYGIFATEYGEMVLGNDNEISGAASHGIYGSGYGMAYPWLSGNQVNNCGGWGVNMANLSFGQNVSIISYTGNASGSYTADASSKNT